MPNRHSSGGQNSHSLKSFRDSNASMTSGRGSLSLPSSPRTGKSVLESPDFCIIMGDFNCHLEGELSHDQVVECISQDCNIFLQSHLRSAQKIEIQFNI